MIHNTKNQKFVISTLVFAFIILSVIVLTFSADKNTNKKITGYIDSTGWIIEKNPVEISHYSIPVEFNSVFTAYNEIQKRAGFDLSKYKGKTITSYTYRVMNHRLSEETDIYITILLCKGEIIGGEISSTGKASFIHEITDTNDLISS